MEMVQSILTRARARFKHVHSFDRCGPVAWSNTGSPRFTDFTSLCACSESSLTNLIGSGLNLLCLQGHSKTECRWTWPGVAILGARPLGTRMALKGQYGQPGWLLMAPSNTNKFLKGEKDSGLLDQHLRNYSYFSCKTCNDFFCLSNRQCKVCSLLLLRLFLSTEKSCLSESSLREDERNSVQPHSHYSYRRSCREKCFYFLSLLYSTAVGFSRGVSILYTRCLRTGSFCNNIQTYRYAEHCDHSSVLCSKSSSFCS